MSHRLTEATSVSPSTSYSEGEVLATNGDSVRGEGDDGRKGGDEGDNKVLDARKAEVMRRPYTPTQQEIDEHMATHLPYRAWCPHRVSGKRFLVTTSRTRMARRLVSQ